MTKDITRAALAMWAALLCTTLIVEASAAHPLLTAAKLATLA